MITILPLVINPAFVQISFTISFAHPFPIIITVVITITAAHVITRIGWMVAVVLGIVESFGVGSVRVGGGCGGWFVQGRGAAFGDGGRDGGVGTAYFAVLGVGGVVGWVSVGHTWHRLCIRGIFFLKWIFIFVIIIRVIAFVFVVHYCLHFYQNISAFFFANFEFFFVVIIWWLSNVDLFNLFGVRESLWFNKWFNYFTHPFFDDWLSIDYTTICQIYQMVFWTTAPTAFFSVESHGFLVATWLITLVITRHKHSLLRMECAKPLLSRGKVLVAVGALENKRARLYPPLDFLPWQLCIIFHLIDEFIETKQWITHVACNDIALKINKYFTFVTY